MQWLMARNGRHSSGNTRVVVVSIYGKKLRIASSRIEQNRAEHPDAMRRDMLIGLDARITSCVASRCKYVIFPLLRMMRRDVAIIPQFGRIPVNIAIERSGYYMEQRSVVFHRRAPRRPSRIRSDAAATLGVLLSDISPSTKAK